MTALTTQGNYKVGKYGQVTNLSELPFASGSSHSHFGQCISMRGTIFVDKKINISGCEIRLYPGAEIIIADTTGFELFVVNENGGRHGCDTMW